MIISELLHTVSIWPEDRQVRERESEKEREGEKRYKKFKDHKLKHPITSDVRMPKKWKDSGRDTTSLSKSQKIYKHSLNLDDHRSLHIHNIWINKYTYLLNSKICGRDNKAIFHVHLFYRDFPVSIPRPCLIKSRIILYYITFPLYLLLKTDIPPQKRFRSRTSMSADSSRKLYKGIKRKT